MPTDPASPAPEPADPASSTEQAVTGDRNQVIRQMVDGTVIGEMQGNVIGEMQNGTVIGQVQGVVGDHTTQTYDNRSWVNHVYNYFTGEQHQNPASRPHNERLLLDDVRQEVASRLQQSLHHAMLIQVQKQHQPDQVQHPWSTEVKVGSHPSEPLAANTSIAEMFHSPAISGKLLILGAPGSGKTTTLLDLAQTLVQHAEQDSACPIPVLVSLSAWKDDRQSMPDWLLKELKSKYGVSLKLGQTWLDHRQLLPLLDGLDEVEPQRQERCAEQINQWLQSELRPPGIVVCSRFEEYTAYSTQLHLNGAISLRPLTNEQIHQYLLHVAPSDVWRTVDDTQGLMELLRTPLILSIAVLAYAELSIERWQQLRTAQERLDYLLDTYIQRMLHRPIQSVAYRNAAPNAQKTRHWLVWLAKQLKRTSQDEFLIEQMQPHLLRLSLQRWVYQLAMGAFFGIVDGVIFSRLLTLPVGLIIGIIVALAVGIADHPIGVGVSGDISTIEAFQFSVSTKLVQELRQQLRKNLMLGTVIGIVVGLVWWQNSQLPFLHSVGVSLLYGLLIGLCFGLVFGLIAGLRADIETKVRPNQGIWTSVINTPILTLFIYPVGIVLDSVIISFSGLSVTWPLWFRGFLWSFVLAIGTSGKAFVQHGILRLLLYNDGFVPWNYGRFLNYATERSLLQRVGGRYRFIHKLVQEHFAAMSLR